MAPKESKISATSRGSVHRDLSAAAHLLPGTRLPDVPLAATRGAAVNLARFQERAIVFVYPFTGTPGEPNPPDWDTIPGGHGSTPEAEGFRDCYGELQSLGFEVFGLSGQTSDAQKAFSARVGLPFLLLSDADFKLADALKLPRFETGGTAYLSRITLIVRNGVIYRAIFPVEKPPTHAREIVLLLNQAPV